VAAVAAVGACVGRVAVARTGPAGGRICVVADYDEDLVFAEANRQAIEAVERVAATQPKVELPAATALKRRPERGYGLRPVVGIGELDKPGPSELFTEAADRRDQRDVGVHDVALAVEYGDQLWHEVGHSAPP